MRTLLASVLAVAFAVVAMGSEGCGTETKSTPDEPATKDEPAKKKPKTARVGDTITLEGNTDGSKIAVRLLKIVDPASGGQFDQATAGTRYVGVRVRLSNKGTTTYDDAPSNGASLIVTGDEQAEATLLSEGPCAGQFGSSAKVSPGTRQTGCLAFEVRRGKNPKRFQFTLDSGFGPATGEWTIGR